MSRLDEVFEKKKPGGVPQTSSINDACLEKPISTLVFPSTLLIDEQEKPIDLEPESLEKIIDWREILSMSEEVKCLFEHRVRKNAQLSRLDFRLAHLSNKNECTETPVPPDPD